MFKNSKTVGMILLLGSMSTGLAHAAFETSVAGTNVVQQGSVCKGIVKDANGELLLAHL